MEYIEIDKNMIPYRFDMTLSNETYTFEVYYNALKDYFTLNLLKGDKVIVLGEKVVYGRALFTTSKYRDIPKVKIIPLDLTGKTQRVTFENLNRDVFLFLVGDEDEVLD